MENGKFYFIKDEYYDKFSNCNIMGNKENDECGQHGRPCFYCFEFDGYFWMIPISSQVDKYRRIYEDKMLKYNGNYDGIRFGYVNGQNRAFLLQNIIPVTNKYIDNQYFIENGTIPVIISDDLSSELNKIARKIVRLYKSGIKIVLTDLDYILSELDKEQKE